MLAAIRTFNRLECVGETLRAALNGVASIAPEWLRERAAPEWFDRYSTRIEESRLPKGKEARTLYAERIGADGSQLLSALYDPSAPVLLWKLPAVQTLRQTWVFQYYSEEGQLLGRYQEALAAFEQTLRLDPMYLRAYTNEGNMLHQLGRHQEGDATYEQYRVVVMDALEHNRPVDFDQSRASMREKE